MPIHTRPAFSIAAALSDADREGKLLALLNPDLTLPERAVAQVEGWILGVGGLHRGGDPGDGSKDRPCRKILSSLH